MPLCLLFVTVFTEMLLFTLLLLFGSTFQADGANFDHQFAWP
jgi:hypothetical protein